jgi:hypothetical protein
MPVEEGSHTHFRDSSQDISGDNLRGPVGKVRGARNFVRTDLPANCFSREQIDRSRS